MERTDRRGERGHHLTPGGPDEAAVVLRVGARFGVAHHADGILLRLDPGWHKVAVPHIVAVIDTYHKQVERIKQDDGSIFIWLRDTPLKLAKCAIVMSSH